ncbi:transposase [Paraburkholderia sp. USG1]|uniref:transposase n=1 Tax=Paraburkholderia sp. USG1 TaxID=2952268 RepID=UPI0028598136|nr:transposase [Paraburkholderia sp. USG1]MDR8395184.1 transposase [Paraburkholderia sp. USG1]
MWLQSIERRDGILKAKAMVNGDFEWTTLEATWELDTPIAPKSKMSGKTCFSRWEAVDAGDYLDETGIEVDVTENKHQVFAVDCNGLRLVVPAIVVLKALFRPNATVFDYLFRPSGLDMLLTPTVANGSMSVALLPRRMRQHVPVGETTFARLQWLYCFPSARAAFDSVYRNAASGVFGVKLPSAQADISVGGQLRGNRFFVSVLNISTCTPLELPFEWAGEQPKQFRLTRRRTGEHLNPVLADVELLKGVAGWELSDAEWSRVEHLFPGGSKLTTGSRARSLVGAILTKLGTGAGWSSANSKFGTTSAVSSFYRNCRRSGRWDEVVTTLMEARKQSLQLAENLQGNQIPIKV